MLSVTDVVTRVEISMGWAAMSNATGRERRAGPQDEEDQQGQESAHFRVSYLVWSIPGMKFSGLRGKAATTVISWS